MTRPRLLPLLVLLVLVAQVPAQQSERLYTIPASPSSEALDRLNLTTAWTGHVPMAGLRDGIFRIQIAPNPEKKTYEIFVQTTSGLLAALDAETGRTLWSTRLGMPYRPAHSVAWNNELVFLINNIQLFAVSRASGAVQWQYALPSGASGPPVADEQRLYLPMSGRGLTVYELPSPEFAAAAPTDTIPKGAPQGYAFKAVNVVAISTTMRSVGEASVEGPRGPQPRELFAYPLGSRVESAAAYYRQRLVVAEVAGTILGVSGNAQEVTARIPTRGDIQVPVGQIEGTAFVASNDLTLYAVDILSGFVNWRFPIGSVVLYRPAATEEGLYVTAIGTGLTRMDRVAGLELWRNSDAERFLASNAKFVYALDRSGRLLILDRVRGTTLSTYGATRDFVVPVPNEWTDRLYLAANNGMIVCLRDKEYRQPLTVKKVPVSESQEERKPGPKGAPLPETKPAAKAEPVEEKKD